MLLRFWTEKKLGVWLTFILALVALLVWSQVAFASGKGHLVIKVYDVGQGDSIYIQTPSGYHLLVDGGPNDKVINYLNHDLGVGNRQLDLVILTHPQSDHMKGLISVLKKFTVKKVLATTATNQTADFQMWKDSLKAEKLEPIEPLAGDSISLADGVTLSFVWPTQEAVKTYTDLNTTCIVFKLSYGSFDALLTGDADQQVQPYSGTIGQVEVLKVPHHGSKTGTSQELLDLIKPEVSIISVAAKNRYGHPAANTIEMLANIGSKIFRTDQNGTIEVESDGERWYTRTER